MPDPERSASGAPIHRHEESAEVSISHGDPELVAAVEAHVTQHFGEPTAVWHQIVSPYVHVDVHVVAPNDRQPVNVLVTSGMSEQPMAGPEGDLHAELFMIVPPTFARPGAPGFEEAGNLWPFELLQFLARLPHEYSTFLWAGHTVPNADPPRPYGPGTRLSGALLAQPLIAPEGFETLRHADREIHFFGVIPLHADEMRLKLDEGLDRLHDLLDEARVSEILDPDRPSVAPPRRRGLFRRR